MTPRGKGVAGSAFSGMDELFHGTAKQAQIVREEQKRKAVQLGKEGDLLKITMKEIKQESQKETEN